jgi:23S rRNA (cytosine1962-C5)-methyltransferase
MKNFENRQAGVFLKKGREKSVKNRHPWIFSGAIERVEGSFKNGDILPVYNSQQHLLGKGFINSNSQIRLRLLTFRDETIDDNFFRQRIEQAIRHRKNFIPLNTTAYRLVHSEGDLLPGLIVDRYADTLVTQFNTLGISLLKADILKILQDLTAPQVIVEKSGAGALKEEGLSPVRELHHGKLSGPVQVTENGVKFLVDILEGQKTGFFLDQRDNRQRIGELAAAKSVLNCFAYTGGFSVYAARNGATTTSLEISESALSLAKENFSLNGFDATAHEFITGNVFEFLRTVQETYDIIILDPPAFVKHKKDVEKGARGYKDINRLAIKQVQSGGLVLTCSCSAFVNRDLFRKIIFSAAREAERNVHILAQPGQPPDHPVNIFHPEGEYLKTLLLRVFD